MAANTKISWSAPSGSCAVSGTAFAAGDARLSLLIEDAEGQVTRLDALAEHAGALPPLPEGSRVVARWRRTVSDRLVAEERSLGPQMLAREWLLDLLAAHAADATAPAAMAATHADADSSTAEARPQDDAVATAYVLAWYLERQRWLRADAKDPRRFYDVNAKQWHPLPEASASPETLLLAWPAVEARLLEADQAAVAESG